MRPENSIFISYRRSDSNDVTGRIYDRLKAEFGREAVFKDVDSIPFGANVQKHLNQSLEGCKILLAVIGPTWIGELKRRSQESTVDWVHEEINLALQREIVVIPLLVRGASMPGEAVLPDSIKIRDYLNAAQVRPDPDFHNDMNRLISGLELTLEKTSSPISVPNKATTGRQRTITNSLGRSNASNLKQGSVAKPSQTFRLFSESAVIRAVLPAGLLLLLVVSAIQGFLSIIWIIGCVISGLVAGAGACATRPRYYGRNLANTLITGITGSFIGGLLFNLLMFGGYAYLTFSGIIAAIVGSGVSLFIYYATRKPGNQ